MQRVSPQKLSTGPYPDPLQKLLFAVTAGTINYHRSQGPQQLATVEQLVITSLFILLII
jgi:hypothetical protein